MQIKTTTVNPLLIKAFWWSVGPVSVLTVAKCWLILLPRLWTPTLQLGSFWCWALALLASYCSFWEWKGSARHLIDQFLAYWITGAYIHTGTHTWIIYFLKFFLSVPVSVPLRLYTTSSNNNLQQLCSSFHTYSRHANLFSHFFHFYVFTFFLPHFCRQWWNIRSIYKNSWMHTKVRIRRQQWSISCHNEW